MDSANKIVVSMQGAALKENIALPTAEQVKDIIGISLVPAIKTLFEINDDEQANRLADYYKQEYLSQDHLPCSLFEGVLPLLTRLGGNKNLAVATGKARQGLNKAWSETNTAHFFKGSRCADEAQSKPHPDMLLQLLDEFSVDVSEAVMIGDTSHDMAMAESIGMDRVAVSYGAHDIAKLEKHKPTEIVHSVLELDQYL